MFRVIMDFKNIIKPENAIEEPVILPGINANVKIFIKRLDLIHPHISGNKWFKLKFNLEEAKTKSDDTLLTFGGAYSNHIYAVAAAGKLLGFNTIGIIRGEETLPLNPTLHFAKEQGMQIFYVSRSEYRNKHTKGFQDQLKEKFGNVYIIPEGGTNQLALKGTAEIPELIETDYNYLCTPCGTAGTISGLIAGLKGENNILGFSVLKGGGFLIDNVHTYLNEYCRNAFSNWSINLDYHFGGYAKINKELIKFKDEFKKLNSIPLDYIYTAKMIYGIYDLIKNGYFPNGSSIMALHTGGLQGNAGMENKRKNF